MMELWRSIPSHPNYHISNFGRLRKLRKDGTFRTLSSPATGKGYLMAELWANGVMSKKAIASLVLEAFVGPRPKGYDCAHINGSKRDNHIVNLMWATRKENIEHNRINGCLCRGESNGMSKLDENSVCFIRKHYKIGLNGSARSLAQKFNVSKKTILSIARRDSWAHVK